jgi:hypothetical protein
MRASHSRGLWLARLVALPLTLFAQWARAAVTDTGRIHHAQAPVSFSTPLLAVKRMACWALEGSVGLEREVSAGEAARFPRRVAVAGGPYPEAEVGVGEAIEVAGRLLSEMAGANSVVRRGVGSN